MGSCHVNSRLAPSLVVAGARLYFYDHSFVNEDTSEVFVPPEYAHEALTVAALPAEASLSPSFIYVHAPCAFSGNPPPPLFFLCLLNCNGDLSKLSCSSLAGCEQK